MLGLWLEGNRLALRDDLAAPDPPSGEALVRVLTAGICGTDLEMLRGYSSFRGIPGHEFVGRVERGPGHLVGRRVVGEINAVCGRCATCAAGRGNHCERRTVLGIVGRNGAFAERIALPVANLHVVPDALPDECAVFTEPLAAALRIGEQVDLRPGLRVLVVGDGRLGQLIARVLVVAGCDPVAVGRHASKLRLLEGAGVRTARAEEVSGGRFDLAIECTGGPGGFDLARHAVRPRGTLVLKSTSADRLPLDASGLVVDEITVIGSRCGPFGPALRLLAEGRIDPRPLVAARYPLSRGVEAFDHAGRPGVLKVLVEVA